MSDTTAKVRAKGCDATGITEEIASSLYANKDKRIMAIVELQAVERHEKADGTRRVDLTLEMVEPATEEVVSEHLRELTRTMYQNRAIEEGQLAIEDSLTPSLTDAVAAGAQMEPHPFLPTDASDDFTGCEVCGLGEAAAPHRAYEVRAIDDPFEVPANQPPEEADQTLADPDDPETFETLPVDAQDREPVST